MGFSILGKQNIVLKNLVLDNLFYQKYLFVANCDELSQSIQLGDLVAPSQIYRSGEVPFLIGDLLILKY